MSMGTEGWAQARSLFNPIVRFSESLGAGRSGVSGEQGGGDGPAGGFWRGGEENRGGGVSVWRGAPPGEGSLGWKRAG